MNCSAPGPCRCKRINAKCRSCRQDVTISHGELAPPVDKDNYVCGRCRGFGK